MPVLSTGRSSLRWVRRRPARSQRSKKRCLDGASQIAVPALVSTLSICIVFVPMFVLSGVARYLFAPLAEAVAHQHLFADDKTFADAIPRGRPESILAEYRALLRGLERARDLGATEIEIVNDSELIARQLTGAYKVKHPAMKPLYLEAIAALSTFERWHVRTVPRALNASADALVNAALDAA